MKFLSVRDLRNHPGEVWKKLREDDLVLTSNGKPRGILVGLEDDDIERVLESLHRARAMTAVSRMRQQAAAARMEGMPAEEIEHEIQAARSERKR